MSDTDRRRYIVIPALNAFNADDETPSVAFSKRLARMGSDPSQIFDFMPHQAVEPIDGDAAAVVEMSEDERLALAAAYPGLQIALEGELRMFPVQGYSQDLKPPKAAERAIRTAKTLEITVRMNGAPLPDADVVVVFDKAAQTGVGDMRTDAEGRVVVKAPPRRTTIDLIIATPLRDAWPVHRETVPIPNPTTRVELDAEPIDPAFQDALARWTTPAVDGDGEGVKIAVIDGGVSGPPTLDVAFSLNTTEQEPADRVEDNGSGHGTHVASVIRRLAPAARLYNYRVFTTGARTAREAAIARAIHHAVDQGCDLINLSLGQTGEPIAIVREIRRARAFGTLCVAAAGNDFGGPVSHPARSTYVQAVSAIGDLKAWPANSARDLDVDPATPPTGDLFFAAFSNRGPEIALTMPGAGIAASVGPDHQGVMSGTSMACPAAVGMIARLLSSDVKVLTMDRDQARSDEIAKLAAAAARPVGFGAALEGQGRLA